MKKIVLILLSAALLFAGPALAKDTIRIGLMCPLTGSWASEGQEMKRIVQLLAEQVNEDGGLMGKRVEIVLADDGGDPRTASLAAQRLATKDVAGVIGTYGSSITRASQNIYASADIIQIANGSTAVSLTEKGLEYFFRTCPREDEQGKVAVDTMLSRGYKRIAVLHDNTTYARGLADEARGLLDDEAAEVVFFDALTPGEQDYNTILTKMKATKPDVVFFTGYYPEAGLLLRQKKEMGWDVPFIGGDATNNPDLVKIAGSDAAKGFHFLSPPVPGDLATEQASAFLEDYKKKYRDTPGSIWAVLAGDGFLVLAEAIGETESTDPDKLADYLHNGLTAFAGLTGKISFNEQGDRVGDVYRIYTVNARGEFVLQE